MRLSNKAERDRSGRETASPNGGTSSEAKHCLMVETELLRGRFEAKRGDESAHMSANESFLRHGGLVAFC